MRLKFVDAVAASTRLVCSERRVERTFHIEIVFVSFVGINSEQNGDEHKLVTFRLVECGYFNARKELKGKYAARINNLVSAGRYGLRHVS